MTEPVTVSPDDLPLQCLYRWERERGDQIFLTQPMGAGQVQNITWAEAADQARRMATWLTAQGWPEGSRVAIIGKNSSHWIFCCSSLVTVSSFLGGFGPRGLSGIG